MHALAFLKKYAGAQSGEVYPPQEVPFTFDNEDAAILDGAINSKLFHLCQDYESWNILLPVYVGGYKIHASGHVVGYLVSESVSSENGIPPEGILVQHFDTYYVYKGILEELKRIGVTPKSEVSKDANSLNLSLRSQRVIAV